MKKLAKSLLVGNLLALSAAVSANNLVTMQLGDQKTFKSNGELSTVEVIQTSGNWKQYSNFLGQENQYVWTREDSSQVYLYNSNSGTYDLLVDFADENIGTEYEINIDRCTTTATFASKGVTETLAAGQFKDTALLTFDGNCANEGLAFAVFAPEVGLISYATKGTNGFVRNEMVSGTVNGVSYPMFSGVKVTSEFPAGPVFTNVEGKASAFLTINNESYNTLIFTSPTSKTFDISIIDASGVVVNKWSANKRFLSQVTSVEIPAGESMEFGGEVNLVDFNGQALDVGTYLIRIELTGTNKPAASVFTAVPYAAESPLYVDQRIVID